MTGSTRQKLVTIGGVAAIVVLVLGGSILYDNLSGGPDARQASINANKIIEGQDTSQHVSDCKTVYATADRVSSSNLDVTKAEVIDLFAQLVLAGGGAPTPGLLDEFHRAEARLSASVVERAAVADVQANINRDCADGHATGVPHVDPVEPLAS